MSLRIKNKEVTIPKMRVWTQTAHFSFTHIEKIQKEDEELNKILGSWDSIIEKRKWIEKFWITAEDEKKAKQLIDKFLSFKTKEAQGLKDFKFKLMKDLSLSHQKALGLKSSIHSKLVKSWIKNLKNEVKK